MAPRKFHQKLVEQRPELIGKHVWFCPNKAQRLECVINRDGTLSTIGSPEKSFEKAEDLTKAILANEIVVGDFKLPRRDSLGQCSFTKCIFMFPNQHLVYTLIDHPEIPLPDGPLESGSVICPGFRVENPNSGKIDCRCIKEIDGTLFSRHCIGRKRGNVEICKHCSKARAVVKRSIKLKEPEEWKNQLIPLKSKRRSLERKRLLCHGVKREQFEQLIDSRKWESERRDVSFIRFFGNRLFSIKCTGEKSGPRKIRCWHCNKMRKSLQLMRNNVRRRQATTETNHLLYTSVKYLSTTDLTKKAAILRRRREEKMKKLRRDLELARKPITPKQMERLSEIVDSIVHKESTCEWVDPSGVQCGHKADTTRRLLAHVTNVHIAEQKSRILNMDPVEIPYRCGWKNCKSDPFATWCLIYMHVQTHVGPLRKMQRHVRRKTFRQRPVQAVSVFEDSTVQAPDPAVV